jgi:hypothetical protein
MGMISAGAPLRRHPKPDVNVSARPAQGKSRDRAPALLVETCDRQHGGSRHFRDKQRISDKCARFGVNPLYSRPNARTAARSERDAPDFDLAAAQGLGGDLEPTPEVVPADCPLQSLCRRSGNLFSAPVVRSPA